MPDVYVRYDLDSKAKDADDLKQELSKVWQDLKHAKLH